VPPVGFSIREVGRTGKLTGASSLPPVGFSTVEPALLVDKTGMNVGLPVAATADACVSGSIFRNLGVAPSERVNTSQTNLDLRAIVCTFFGVPVVSRISGIN
jgi:hypothetical protein